MSCLKTFLFEISAVTNHWREHHFKSLVFFNQSDMLGVTHAVSY